jgi:superfamily II RNA helicase
MKTYKRQLEEIQKVLSGGVDEKETEFNSRTAVLTQYKIVDNDLNLLFKGKVASKVSSADSILLTEFFFSGLINELTDQELLAIVSILNNQQRAPGQQPECIRMYSESFKKAYAFMLSETEKLIGLEETFGIHEEKKFEKRLNFCFYEAVYDWADGMDFIDIINECMIEEGIVLKMFMTVDRIRQSLAAMAKVVGDNALAQRLEGMKPLIDRGIVKMQSLYLEVEHEQPKLLDPMEVIEESKE